MKLLVVLASVALVAAAVKEGPQNQKFAKIAAKCGEDQGTTRIDPGRDAKSSAVLTKKIMLCTFRAGKIMDENDKLDKEQLMELLLEVLDHRKPDEKERTAMARTVSENCEKDVGSGAEMPEDTAQMIVDCVERYAAKNSSRQP